MYENDHKGDENWEKFTFEYSQTWNNSNIKSNSTKFSVKMDGTWKNIGFLTLKFINLPNNEVKYI